MDVRLNRTDRLIEDLSDLWMAAPFDESQRRRGTKMHRELQQGALDERDLGILLDDRLGLGWPLMRLAEDRVGVGEGVERDVGGPLAPQAIPRHVQRDRVEPGLKTQVGPLLRRHLSERTIGSHEGVLDDLLGVFAIPGHPERKAVEAALVIVDDPLEVRHARRGIGRGVRHRGSPGRGCWHVYSRKEWCERAHTVPRTTTARAEVSHSPQQLLTPFALRLRAYGATLRMTPLRRYAQDDMAEVV